MRKVQYFVACSVDGFIAHEDGTWEGFLMEGRPVNDYLDSLRRYETVLMGRRTYEVGLRAGTTDPYPSMDSYVFSRTLDTSPDERVHLVSGDAGAMVRELKNREGGDIYLCGGAGLATALLKEGLIDEIILKVNPFLMGSGIPLFRGAPQTTLELLSSKTYDNGCVWLHYRVGKAE